jgi:hypothetical protein
MLANREMKSAIATKVFRYFRLWPVDIKEQKCLGEGNKTRCEPPFRPLPNNGKGQTVSDLCCAGAQVYFFRPLPCEGRALGQKSRGLRGCWRGCGKISCSAFKGLAVLLLAINAHGFNGLRSKALLSRQRSIKLLPERRSLHFALRQQRPILFRAGPCGRPLWRPRAHQEFAKPLVQSQVFYPAPN